jgi:hypothetical protein
MLPAGCHGRRAFMHRSGFWMKRVEQADRRVILRPCCPDSVGGGVAVSEVTRSSDLHRPAPAAMHRRRRVWTRAEPRRRASYVHVWTTTRSHRTAALSPEVYRGPGTRTAGFSHGSSPHGIPSSPWPSVILVATASAVSAVPPRPRNSTRSRLAALSATQGARSGGIPSDRQLAPPQCTRRLDQPFARDPMWKSSNDKFGTARRESESRSVPARIPKARTQPGVVEVITGTTADRVRTGREFEQVLHRFRAIPRCPPNPMGTKSQRPPKQHPSRRGFRRIRRTHLTEHWTLPSCPELSHLRFCPCLV